MVGELGTIPIELANGVGEYMEGCWHDEASMYKRNKVFKGFVRFIITDQSLPTAVPCLPIESMEYEVWNVEFNWNGRRWMIKRAWRVLNEPTDNQSTGEEVDNG